MTPEQYAIEALVSAIETIQFNWESGDLAAAVRDAVELKDSVCKSLNIKAEVRTYED